MPYVLSTITDSLSGLKTFLAEHPALSVVIALIAALLLWFIGFAVYKKSSRHGKEMTWAYAFFWGIFALICAPLYRIRKLNIDAIPEKGGVLLFANHMSYVDVIILGLSSNRPIRFLSWAGFERVPVLSWFMRTMHTIPVSPARAKDGIQTAVEALRKGQVVCIFPEGGITRNGSLRPFQGGFKLIASRAGVPVVPVYIDGLWRSVFSYRHKKAFWKMPKLSPLPVTVLAGEPFRMGKNPGDKRVSEARQALLELGYRAFSMRKEFQQKHIAETIFEAAASHPFRIGIIDHSRERMVLKRGILMAAAYCLARRIRRQVREHRVGIVLPAGTPGVLANYAVSLAGKIPVNLNFTLGRAQVEACLQKAKIRTMITVAPMKKQIEDRLPEFPWTKSQIDILTWMKNINRSEIILAFLELILLPKFITKRLWRIPTKGGDREAALLFTSGSSGMPKAAVISHRNIIANVTQIEDYEILPPKTRLLCNLPIFHCFGFTVLLWFAGTQDIVAVTTPSPLDYQKNLMAIEKEKLTAMFSTPTFLRSYLKKATPEQMKSLYLAVAGAEKSPDGFAKAWEEKFPNSHYLDGYGMTEASPVVSANKPDVPVKNGEPGEVHVGTKPGAVGILFPGMSAKVVNVDDDSLCDFNEPGMLYLKGPNIFPGYLNDDGVPVPATDEEGWYKSGDIVSMDESGFITIRGRLSRFSKIGGEMVPHGTIEETISKVLELDIEQLQIAISARPDPAKGEQIVLLTTIADLNLSDLCKKLSAAGLANLWLPREMKVIEKIPVLGTGKLDLKACAAMAAEK